MSYQSATFPIIHIYSYIFFCTVTRIYIPVHSLVMCYVSYYPLSSALPQTKITTKETHLYWDIVHVWRCYVYIVREFAHECVVLVLRMASIPSFLVNFLTLFILIATIYNTRMILYCRIFSSDKYFRNDKCICNYIFWRL